MDAMAFFICNYKSMRPCFGLVGSDSPPLLPGFGKPSFAIQLKLGTSIPKFEVHSKLWLHIVV